MLILRMPASHKASIRSVNKTPLVVETDILKTRDLFQQGHKGNHPFLNQRFPAGQAYLFNAHLHTEPRQSKQFLITEDFIVAEFGEFLPRACNIYSAGCSGRLGRDAGN